MDKGKRAAALGWKVSRKLKEIGERVEFHRGDVEKHNRLNGRTAFVREEIRDRQYLYDLINKPKKTYTESELRKEFEKVYGAIYNMGKIGDDYYSDGLTRTLWQGWLAACKFAGIVKEGQ